MLSYITFKSLFRLFESEKQPTFVSVKPDLDSIESLVELAEVLGLSSQDMVPESELHATVTYSRSPIEDPRAIVREFLPIHATGDELHVFKTRNEGKSCLVLKLSSVSLRALHAAILKTGASHDFPTFEAHVTLCYDTPQEILDRAKEFIDLGIDLVFNDFESKKLDLDWKPA